MQNTCTIYSTLRIFGCPTYSLVNSKKRNKLEFKSKRYYFIGFTKGTMTFRLRDAKKSAFVSKDVIFDEDSMLQTKSKTEDEAQGGVSDSSADSQRV